MCSRNVRSETLCTVTPSIASTLSTTDWLCSESWAEQVTSTTSRSWRDSAMSIAVTMPPACAMVVATVPITPGSGSVYSRMVIEYEEAVAPMGTNLERRHGRGQAPRTARAGRHR
jgi:hypothetical protein